MSAAMPASFTEIERTWRPDPIVRRDHVGVRPTADLAALLDQASPLSSEGDVLPPLWHWVLFPALHRQADLGADGHPREGALTPPLPDRRRMFGGGRLHVNAPLRCGDTVERREQVTSVRTTVGTSGPLLLVTVRHDLCVEGDLRIWEEQDFVYRRAIDVSTVSSAVTPATSPLPCDHPVAWHLTIRPDPVLLFRFSALTANAHRIHYDRPYATDVEQHPGLVVHGPLLALLMLELPRRHASESVVELRWRARRAVYDHDDVVVTGHRVDGGAKLFAGNADEPHRFEASIRFTPPGSGLPPR